MTTIYFVRHAHSTYTPDEYERPLSDSGMKEAKRVTELLKREGIDVIISSPYKRAYQTVEGIAEYLGVAIEVVEDLKERTLTLAPAEDFNIAITKVWEDFDFSWEGGESSAAAQTRGVAAIVEILEKYKGKNIVIGTHGNIMVLIMNYFNKNYDFTFWKNLDMPDIYKLEFTEDKLVHVERLWQDINSTVTK